MIVPGRRRWWALGALAVSVLVAGLDLTVLNLALPALAVSLHAGTGDLQWSMPTPSRRADGADGASARQAEAMQAE